MVQGWATSPETLTGAPWRMPGRAGRGLATEPKIVAMPGEIDRPWAWLVGSEVHAGSDLTSE
jgi:hypothetical protein